MNDKTVVLGLSILLLLLVALITHSGDVLWMAVPFLAYLGVGILQAPSREKLSLRVKRTFEQERVDGKVSTAVRLTVQNTAPGTVHLFLQETVQPGMEMIDGELSRRVSLVPGESTELSYAFTTGRGNFSWKSVRAVVADPLGMIETEMALPDGSSVQVRPQIRKFRPVPLHPQNTVHSPGSIPVRLGGSGTDFFGVREYHPGDPLRSLDWRLAARHPGRLFTREFQQEEIAEIGLLLDARPKNELRIGEQSLFEHSLGATLSLAEMFLHQGHRVSLLVFGGTLASVFPGYGKTQLQRILSCLSQVRIEPAVNAPAYLDFLPVRMFPSHALMVIISPLAANDRPFFQRLRAHGYQALLVSPDPLDFVQAGLPQDTIGQFAIRAARLERQVRLNGIAQLHIPVIDWQVSQPLGPLVRNALARSRKLWER